MMKINPPVSLAKIVGYALGEGAVSITMNGIANFAMLYYTQVLGLGATYAGLALGITMFWDAITDPVMGHVSDNTRSRFGRRHPYILLGGILLAFSFYLLWLVPGKFTGPVTIFWCVLLINLLVRTAVTIFVVPYTALGFEICPEYVDRTRLQGVRYFLNQTVNLIFGAFAWILFFKDGVAPDGGRIDGTTVLGNYMVMGSVLAVATLLLIFLCVFCTRDYAKDNRQETREGNGIKDFWRDITSIFQDRLALSVFGFFWFVQMSMLLTSQIQMFTYVFYMEFPAVEKTWVHGAGMAAFALGSLSLSRLVKRFDKKQAGYIGVCISMFGGLALAGVFTSGLVAPKATWELAGRTIPLGTVVFGILQGMWWGGCGILVPLAASMIADISEVNHRRTGILKDGSYAAVFSFFIKAAASVGLFATGWMVDLSGIVSKAELQTSEAIRNISIMTFLCGPVVILFSTFVLRKYPIDRAYMEKLRAETDESKAD